MQAFLKSLYAEFFKTRKTLAFWSAILLPLLICGLVFTGFYFKHEGLSARPPMSQWLFYAMPIMLVMGNLILPIFVIFMTYSINAIEHRSDTWKSMFSMPISKWTIYTAKYFYTILLIGLSLFLFCSLTLLSGNLLSALIPELGFKDFSVTRYAFGVYTKLFLSSLGIVSIQFLLSLLWSDFLKPMGIGFVCFIAGSIAGGVNWTYAWIIPYAHPQLALLSLPRPRKPLVTELPVVELLTKEVWVGLLIAAGMYIVGYFAVVRKSIK